MGLLQCNAALHVAVCVCRLRGWGTCCVSFLRASERSQLGKSDPPLTGDTEVLAHFGKANEVCNHFRVFELP